MSESLYREFVLSKPEIAGGLWQFIKANAAAFCDRKTPLRVIVTSKERRRTNEQNRFWHGPMLDRIAECAWWDGRQFPKEFWKEYFRKRYLLKDEYTTPTGEIVQVYWSTADLDVEQMAQFMTKVQVECATEWGIEFS